FNPDPTANGTLTPTHLYSTAGDYEVVLKVTDNNGDITYSSLAITVTNIAPTATVSNSGPTAEGAPVWFTVSGITDPDPADFYTFWADWTGSGEFKHVPEDQVQSSQNGPATFSHVYDDNSGTGGYAAKIRVMDALGDYNDYTTT